MLIYLFLELDYILTSSEGHLQADVASVYVSSNKSDIIGTLETYLWTRGCLKYHLDWRCPVNVSPSKWRSRYTRVFAQSCHVQHVEIQQEKANSIILLYLQYNFTLICTTPRRLMHFMFIVFAVTQQKGISDFDYRRMQLTSEGFIWFVGGSFRQFHCTCLSKDSQ